MKRGGFFLVLAAVWQVHCKFPKCCPDGQALDLHTKACKDSVRVDKDQLETLTIEVGKDGKTWDKVALEETLEVALEKEWTRCNASSSYILESSKFKVYNTSKRVLLFDVINKKPHPNNTFCIDIAHDYKTSEYEAVAKLCQPCQDPEKPCLNFHCQEGKVGPDCSEGVEDLDWLSEVAFTRITVPLHCKKASVIDKPNLFNLTNEGMVIDGKVRDFSEFSILLEPNKSHSLYFCEKEDDSGAQGNIKIVFLVLSLLSLLALILLHLFIEELWRYHFTKLKVPFFISTFVSFFFILISQFDATETVEGVCIFLGLMIQYWSLAMFLCLTTMSKSIWRTFYISTLQNPLSQNQAHRQARQLRERQRAAGISFGLPFLLLLVTLLIQKFGDQSLDFHPNLQKSCSLNQFLPLFLFFHLPLLLLLLLNLVFYALLVFKFSCGIWASSIQDDSDHAWRNLKVVLELFVFMGIYWLPEVRTTFATSSSHLTLSECWLLHPLVGFEELEPPSNPVLPAPQPGRISFMCNKHCLQFSTDQFFPTVSTKMKKNGMQQTPGLLFLHVGRACFFLSFWY